MTLFEVRVPDVRPFPADLLVDFTAPHLDQYNYIYLVA
jgi:hypothetical protein